MTIPNEHAPSTTVGYSDQANCRMSSRRSSEIRKHALNEDNDPHTEERGTGENAFVCLGGSQRFSLFHHAKALGDLPTIRESLSSSQTAETRKLYTLYMYVHTRGIIHAPQKLNIFDMCCHVDRRSAVKDPPPLSLLYTRICVLCVYRGIPGTSNWTWRYVYETVL